MSARSKRAIVLLLLGSMSATIGVACSTTTVISAPETDAAVAPIDAAVADAIDITDSRDVVADAHEGDAAPDASKACEVTGGDVYGSGDICTISKEITCGAEIYEISCACRLMTCSCVKGGVKYKDISASSATCSSTCPGFHFERNMAQERADCEIPP